MTADSLHAPETPTLRICRKVSHAGILLMAASLVTAPAGLSIGVAVAVLPALVSMPLKLQFRRFLHGGMLFWFPFLLLPLIASWFWTFQKVEWAKDLLIKLPMCLAPYAIAVLGVPPRKVVRGALWLLLLSVMVASTGTVIQYWVNKEEVDKAVAMSKPIHTFLGSPHIYFSVISAFVLFVALWLFRQREPLFWKGERWIALVLGLILLGFMHVITTRTGLVAFYLTATVVALVRLVASRKYLQALLAVTLITALPITGYFLFPSLRNRVENTRMDVTRYFAGMDPNYLSIGTRIESYKVAYHLIQRSDWMGVGMGDLKDEMNYQYVVDQSQVCPENQIEPHNQFIQMCAGLGIVPCLLFALAWFSPLRKRWRPAGDSLFWPFWFIFTLSMMGESMVERQTGVGFLVLVLALTYEIPLLRAETEPAKVN